MKVHWNLLKSWNWDLICLHQVSGINLYSLIHISGKQPRSFSQGSKTFRFKWRWDYFLFLIFYSHFPLHLYHHMIHLCLVKTLFFWISNNRHSTSFLVLLIISSAIHNLYLNSSFPYHNMNRYNKWVKWMLRIISSMQMGLQI